MSCANESYEERKDMEVATSLTTQHRHDRMVHVPLKRGHLRRDRGEERGYTRGCLGKRPAGRGEDVRPGVLSGLLCSGRQGWVSGEGNGNHVLSEPHDTCHLIALRSPTCVTG